MEQGSDAWRKWRRTKRMASLSPAVMNASPWQTRRDVIAFYRDGKDATDNPAMAFGRAHESDARSYAANLLNEFLTPCVVEQDEYAASLDGLTDDGETLIEAKAPYRGTASETFKAALQDSAGGYRWQIQHQLMVTGCKRALYVVWTLDQSVHLFVEPDLEMHKAIRAAWDALWAEMLDGSGLERDDPQWLAAVAAYRGAKAVADVAELALTAARDGLVGLATRDRETGAGIVLQKVERKGVIEYAKVPELAGVNLEAYRKAASTSWRIDEAK
jgi:putative phage-type endonuclease